MIFKEGERGYKKISLEPKLVEHFIIIGSLSPPKFEKKTFFVLLAPTLPHHYKQWLLIDFILLATRKSVTTGGGLA